jgi:hypothetical protein
VSPGRMQVVAFQVGDRVRILDTQNLGDVRCLLPGGFVEVELGSGQLVTTKAVDLALVAHPRPPVELSPEPVPVRSLIEEGEAAAARHADRVMLRASLLVCIAGHLEGGELSHGQEELFGSMRDYLQAEEADAIEPEQDGLPTTNELALVSPGELDELERASVTVLRLRFAVARRRLRDRAAVRNLYNAIAPSATGDEP